MIQNKNLSLLFLIKLYSFMKKQILKPSLIIVLLFFIFFFLYFFNPSDFKFFPRCPFLILTGYQCPGCGTLRGIHALLNLRFMDAMKLNPLMVASIPLIIVLLINKKIALHQWTPRVVFIIVILWWIFRNF